MKFIAGSKTAALLLAPFVSEKIRTHTVSAKHIFVLLVVS